MQARPIITALSLFVLSQGVQAIPTISFNSASTDVLVGDTFTLTLQGAGFDLTSDSKVIDNVTGGQKFNFAFDPALLEVTNITIDPRWNFTSGNKTGVVDNLTGTLTGMAFGTFPATTDDAFNIASITFKALSAGSQAIGITSGEIAARVNSVSGVKILPTLAGSSVQVSAVPEPGQWAMLLAGLGLIGLRLRSR